MGDIRLAVVLALTAFSIQMYGTDGVFFHFPRSFPAPVSQSISSEQVDTNGDFHVPPFLPFFSFFRHRHPFMHVPQEEKKNDVLPSGKNEEPKINSVSHNKTNEVDRIAENDADPMRNRSSNFPDHSVNRKINPYERGQRKYLFDAFPMYPFKRWRFIDGKVPEMTKNKDVQPSNDTNLQNVTEKDIFKENGHHVSKKDMNSIREEKGYSLFEKLRMSQNESLMMNKENCTGCQSVNKYFIFFNITEFKGISFDSLAALLVLMLLVLLIIGALILCGAICEIQGKKTKFLRKKVSFV